MRSLSMRLLFPFVIILIVAGLSLAEEEAGGPTIEQPPAAEMTPAPEGPPAAGTMSAPAAEESAPAATVATPALEEPAVVPPSAEPLGIITSVEVQGYERIALADILAAVTSKVGAVYSEEGVKRDRDAIFALGWFEHVYAERETTEVGIRLVFHVVENPVVSEITFEGATVMSRDQLLGVMKTRPGAVFNRARLADDSRAIDKLYSAEGYILVIVLPPRMTADGVLTLEIAEGVIEAIKVAGNTRTKDYVIRRYIRTKPGDVYNYRKVAADVGRLSNTRWFETVGQSAEVGSEPGKVILAITIVEKKRTGQATVGGGYSSVQGIVAFVDLTKDNLRGTGQMVSVRGEFGGRDSYELYYRHPWIATPETRLNLGVYNRLVVREAFVNPPEGEVESVLYDERRTGGSITFGRPLTDRTTAYLGVRNDRVSVTGVSEEDEPLITGPVFEPRDVRSVTTALASDFRDNRDYPRRGGFYQLSAEFAGWLGGSSDFDKYSADARRYFPIGKKPSLAMRLLGGTITGDAPYLEQFLIGGSESLRGYRTDRFAGSHMVLLNSELRFPIGKKLVGVGFVDIGDAWGGAIAADPTVSGDTSFTAHVGYGIGVRVATPIGPLRLDIGFSEEGTETHFGIAQMF